MRTNRFITGLLTLSLATSCSQSLSSSERSALHALRIADAKTSEKAYQPPQSITQESAATIGFVSGLTLGLVGGLVAGAGVAAKQHGFESKHKSEIDSIKSGTPADLGKLISAELNTQLSADPFFGPRLKSPGQSGRIEIEITGYTLQKIQGGNHSPALAVLGKIVGQDGTAFYQAFAVANGHSESPHGVAGCSAPMATYAANPALLKSHYQKVAAQAARNLADNFKEAASD